MDPLVGCHLQRFFWLDIVMNMTMLLVLILKDADGGASDVNTAEEIREQYKIGFSAMGLPSESCTTEP